jgi:hypothetical protein
MVEGAVNRAEERRARTSCAQASYSLRLAQAL